jgi:L-asparaginase
LKKVAVIFTGGTISMKLDENIQAAIPALSPEELLTMLMGIKKMAEIEAIHFGSFPGPHITPQKMLELSKLTAKIIKRPDITGVVVTHGTDNMEESAYFLDLILDEKKPVVFTGAMRNSSELGYDGPSNLAAAIATVCARESMDKGVLVVMNNQVYAADEVTKTHTLALDTFQSMDFGPLGIVDQDKVIYYRERKNKKHIRTDKIEASVGLIKVASGMDSSLIKSLIDLGMKGIVLEGMGRGNIPPDMVEGVKYAISKNIPVVLVSRCPKGRVLDTYGYPGGGKELRNLGVILGDNLSGQKARIKLMLILGLTKDMDEIKSLFEEGLYTTK